MLLRRQRPGISSVVVVVIVVLIVAVVAVVFLAGTGFGTTHPGSSTTSSLTGTGQTSSSSSASTASSSSSSEGTGTSSSISTSPSSGSNSTIKVQARFSNGTSLSGVYAELMLNGDEVATGYTPAVFNATGGLNYTVAVSDFTDLYFNQWSNGFTSRVIPIAANGSQVTLTAVYTTTQEAPPSTPWSISVTGAGLNGTSLTGFKIDLRVDGYAIEDGFVPVTFSDLEPGLQYQVVAYWYGNYYFRHFSNGELNRYELVTFNSTGTTSESYQAIYQYVPPSQAATLNVIAIFPNGTQIGTTFNNTGYIQHTPGMWLTVTPPNSTTPFTGSDTGGSLLPFVLPEGETYTVTMTNYGDIKFAYWNDTGNTNATRTVSLDQNTTLVAVYEQTGSTPSSLPLGYPMLSAVTVGPVVVGTLMEAASRHAPGWRRGRRRPNGLTGARRSGASQRGAKTDEKML